MSDLIAKLNKAMKPRGDAAGGVMHENEGTILAAATKLLAQTEPGRLLLDFAQKNLIKMHVLKNKNDFGILPSESTVYISCPAGQEMPDMRAVIHLAGALRQAMQDQEPTLQRPNIRLDPRRYAFQAGERKVDQLYWQAAVVHEIYENTGLLEIVDEFASMGYLELYKAYKADLEGEASDQAGV